MKSRTLILWFVMAAALWLAAGCYFNYHTRKLQPAELARTIERNIRQQQQEQHRLLAQQGWKQRLLNNSLDENEVNDLIGQHFLVRVYNHGQLIFWNSNRSPIRAFTATGTPRVFVQHQSVFMAQRIYDDADTGRYAALITPIYWHYDISNQYLKSHFVANPAIPANSQISVGVDDGNYPIRALDSTIVCRVKIDPASIAPWMPDTLMILLCLAALIVSIVSVHMLAFYLGRRYSLNRSALFLATVIIGGRACTYLSGLPFHLGYLELFSPKIFASSAFLPSFGDLVLNVVLAYWLMSFLLSRYGRSHRNFYALPAWIRWTIFLLITLCTGLLGLYQLHILQSLIIDSNISFDSNTLNITDTFTLFVIIILALIIRLFLISLQFASINLNRFIPESRQKYLVLLLFNALVMGILRRMIIPSSWTHTLGEELLYQGAFIMVLIYLYLLNNKRSKSFFDRAGMFGVLLHGVYWCLIITIFFKYYISHNEQYTNRLSFAEKLSRQQDLELEMKFPEISARILADSMIYKWVTGEKLVNANEIHRYFDVTYSESFLSKYTDDIYLYKGNKEPASANATIPFDAMQNRQYSSLPTVSEGLFYHVERKGNDYYIINIPILAPDSDSVAGYFIADLRLRKNIAVSLYPQLLQDNEITSRNNLPNYNYAIYSQGVLKAQSGDHNFSLHIGNKPGNEPYHFYEKGEFSELYYKGQDGIIYVVVYQDKLLTGLLTIFSFLFVFYLLIYLLESWFNLLLAYLIAGKKIRPIYNASLSIRIRYFTIGFLLLSFVVIGGATVLFLGRWYKTSNEKQLEEFMINIADALNEYFDNEDKDLTADNFTWMSSKPDFIYMINNIARNQRIDINLFDARGQLAVSTRNGIYDKLIQSRHMAPNAYYQLSRKQHYRFIQTERIGNLSFTSAYMPLLNRQGKIAGYLNTPSFYSHKALNKQIATLLSAFMYIYTILLLLSGIIIFLFINNLTGSLQLVTRRLKQVNLKMNEQILWPYHDEIGLLVAEYNKMIIAVEKNAESLVKDERQSAWREMAKQVAHEIKNPLTPMKLNIQYLQQAIAQNHPDIARMAARVSASIIEQIDNLSYIASEFSNFAKMPEQHTEELDLIALLQSIVSLYEGKKTEVSLHFAASNNPLLILTDKSQLLRIFTNLIKNAAEAIPDERQGEVRIDVVVNNQWHNILITVKDNGSGIDESVRDKIFDPYFTTKTTGTGLGLAMTRKIIELWNGEIWFESEKDKGTTFFIVLPFDRNRQESV